MYVCVCVRTGQQRIVNSRGSCRRQCLFTSDSGWRPVLSNCVRACVRACVRSCPVGVSAWQREERRQRRTSTHIASQATSQSILVVAPMTTTRKDEKGRHTDNGLHGNVREYEIHRRRQRRERIYLLGFLSIKIVFIMATASLSLYIYIYIYIWKIDIEKFEKWDNFCVGRAYHWALRS